MERHEYTIGAFWQMSTQTGGGEDGLEGGALVPPDSSLRPSDLDIARSPCGSF